MSMGAGSPKVENGVHQTARLKIGRELRHLRFHRRSHLLHIVVATDPVIVRETDLDVRGMRGRIARVDRGESGGRTDV